MHGCYSTRVNESSESLNAVQAKDGIARTDHAEGEVTHGIPIPVHYMSRFQGRGGQDFD